MPVQQGQTRLCMSPYLYQHEHAEARLARDRRNRPCKDRFRGLSACEVATITSAVTPSLQLRQRPVATSLQGPPHCTPSRSRRCARHRLVLSRAAKPAAPMSRRQADTTDCPLLDCVWYRASGSYRLRYRRLCSTQKHGQHPSPLARRSCSYSGCRLLHIVGSWTRQLP